MASAESSGVTVWAWRFISSARLNFRQLGWGRLLLTALLMLMAVALARYSWHVPLAIDAERVLYDWRHVALAPKVDQDSRIVEVVYTDETLAATGKRSPLDRTILAKALTRIESFHPKSIGIDILIDQPQPEDAVLITAMQSLKTPTYLAFASAKRAEDKIMLWQQQFLDAFVARLAPGNVHLTNIVIEPDEDNVLRSWPKFAAGEPGRLPNMVDPQHGAAYRNYDRSVNYRVPAFVESPVFNAIPIDSFATDALFENPMAADIFRKQIEGKIVLIGGHIQDIDLFETPLTRQTGKPTWGVDIFAHMIAQQLDGAPPARIPSYWLWIIAIIVVLAAAATALVNIPLWRMALVGIGQLIIFGGLPFYLQAHHFDTQNLPAFGWGLGWAFAFAGMEGAAREVGSEQRKFAQSALGKYLPRDIATEILRNPEGLSLHGEKRSIFVVFTDLEGFTKLSHAIDPEMVATLLNRYLETLSNVVLQYGGTIDKFVGDAVVAFWGAPISRPDDGERAAKAALAMHQAGEDFRNSAPDGVPPIGRTRVGLHFGEAIVGNFGGEGRIQYTALGDSMNTASRLESANKQTGSSVLVSREAADRSGLDWYRSLGRIVLRGRATPIEIMEPRPDLTATARDSFNSIAKAAIAGDPAAINALGEQAAQKPEDKPLANFVYRLAHQDAGGHFVLE